MLEIPLIIKSSCLAILFVELSGIPDAAKAWLAKKRIWYKPAFSERMGISGGKAYPRRIKPLDCALCLSFWICLSLGVFSEHLEIKEAILTAAISSVFTVGITKFLKP